MTTTEKKKQIELHTKYWSKEQTKLIAFQKTSQPPMSTPGPLPKASMKLRRQSLRAGRYTWAACDGLRWRLWVKSCGSRRLDRLLKEVAAKRLGFYKVFTKLSKIKNMNQLHWTLRQGNMINKTLKRQKQPSSLTNQRTTVLSTLRWASGRGSFGLSQETS